MPPLVALLRGINVGTAKRIAMADLRRLFEDFGCANVRTLLNSGNVVFSARSTNTKALGRIIEKAIAERLRITTRVTVMSGDEIADAVRNNPFSSIADNPSRLLLMALQHSGAVARIKPLIEQTWTPEALALRQRFAYLWCPDGIGTSALWSAASRAVGDEGTARNLTTMTKLAALAQIPARQR